MALSDHEAEVKRLEKIRGLEAEVRRLKSVIDRLNDALVGTCDHLENALSECRAGIGVPTPKTPFARLHR